MVDDDIFRWLRFSGGAWRRAAMPEATRRQVTGRSREITGDRTCAMVEEACRPPPLSWSCTPPPWIGKVWLLIHGLCLWIGGFSYCSSGFVCCGSGFVDWASGFVDLRIVALGSRIVARDSRTVALDPCVDLVTVALDSRVPFSSSIDPTRSSGLGAWKLELGAWSGTWSLELGTGKQLGGNFAVVTFGQRIT